MDEQTTQTSSLTLGSITFEHATLVDSKALLLALLNNPQRPTTLIGFVNPHVYNLACEHDEVESFIKQCRLVCIDGIGVQLAAFIVGRQPNQRIVAEELFNLMLEETSFQRNAVLMGVTQNELSAATSAINQASSSINIIDGIDGFQDDASYTAWLKDHRQTDLILIGAGTPRSEQIALLAKQHCQRAVIWHIGAGTVKTWAGTKRRAPTWVSRMGMQWLHRIRFEPHTRSRYLSGAVRFIKHLTGSAATASQSNGAPQ